MIQQTMKPTRIGVINISDRASAGVYEDLPGKAARDLLASYLTSPWKSEYAVIPDEREQIEQTLIDFADHRGCCLILTTGGTGPAQRDVTPEAFSAVWEKEIPGFGEYFRMISVKHIGVSSIQSRATAGVARGTYMFAVPGSTGACRDAWDEILKWQLDNRFRPCNFVELMPRLQEK